MAQPGWGDACEIANVSAVALGIHNDGGLAGGAHYRLQRIAERDEAMGGPQCGGRNRH